MGTSGKKKKITTVKHSKTLRFWWRQPCTSASLTFPSHCVTLPLAQLLPMPSFIHLQKWKPPPNTQGYHLQHWSTPVLTTSSAYRGEDSNSALKTREVESITQKQPWKAHYCLNSRLLKKSTKRSNLEASCCNHHLTSCFLQKHMNCIPLTDIIKDNMHLGYFLFMFVLALGSFIF